MSENRTAGRRPIEQRKAARAHLGEGDYGIHPPGYCLPASLRLGRVRLQVADLERSLAFYRGLLGLAVLEHDGSRLLLGGHGEGAAGLLELHERPGARPVPRGGRLGLYHVALLLPQRAALGRLLARLLAAGVQPGMADHLVSEALYLNDPDGLGLELYADRPRATWSSVPRAAPGQGAKVRELAMDTRPLDVPGLLRAAGAEPWAGMPGGTVVGHMHLHVGNLDEATAFYHRALGFDLVVWSYPGARFFSAGGYHHHLGVNTWAAGAAPAGEEDARLLDWELCLPADEVAAAAASVAAAGYPVAGEASGEASGEAAGEAAGVRLVDPWGTELRLQPAEGSSAVGAGPKAGD